MVTVGLNYEKKNSALSAIKAYLHVDYTFVFQRLKRKQKARCNVDG